MSFSKTLSDQKEIILRLTCIQVSGVWQLVDQEEIHKQCVSDYYAERIKALEQLKENFLQLSDKQRAWDDLHRLTNDEDWRIRMGTIDVLELFLSNLLYEQLAWNDLIKLITDPDEDVRPKAINSVNSSFSQMSDKQKAWSDLIKLSNKKSNEKRSNVVFILGHLFSQVPDKQKAYNDLLNLTTDKIGYMRGRAADALGSAFYHLPDKQQAWIDLMRLTNDVDSYVRAYANHSLGKISIFKASESENEQDYLEKMEKAIDFFEREAREPAYDLLNPSQFCLPFYRSFYIILFEKEAKEEVRKHLDEAKHVIKGSKSRELLLEIIEDLAKALEEVQNLNNFDLKAKKSELNFYMKYCNHAEELLREAEGTVPYATAAMRKGLPILNRNLKRILEEIQEKANIACRNSIGTPIQEIACAVNREIQKWEISSQEEMSWYVSTIALLLKSKIPPLPENKEILDMIESLKYENDLTKQYRTLFTVIGLIPTVNVVPENVVKEGLEALQRTISLIGAKIEEITVSKPEARGELIISRGLNIGGNGAQLVITVPLAKVEYPEINIDLEKIKGEGKKLSELPERFVNRVKGFLP